MTPIRTNPPTGTPTGTRRRTSSLTLRWIGFLSLCLVCICFNFFHFTKFHSHIPVAGMFPHTHHITKALKKEDIVTEHIRQKWKPPFQHPTPPSPPLSTDDDATSSQSPNKLDHSLAGLSCTHYGGPSDTLAQSEMMYWSDIPTDSHYVSPFYNPDEEEKYMTFEPDGGGWNNIRMAMETTVVMAHAMGRTLVLPPSQKFYLLGNVSLSID